MATATWPTLALPDFGSVLAPLLRLATSFLGHPADNAFDLPAMNSDLDQLDALFSTRLAALESLDLAELTGADRAELCRLKSMMDGIPILALRDAASQLRDTVRRRPELDPSLVAHMNATMAVAETHAERLILAKSRILAAIEIEIDSQDLERLLAEPSSPVPWDDARAAFGL